MIQLTQHRERGGCRGYSTFEERSDDIAELKRQGFDHFTLYRDAEAEIALSYGVCDPKPWNGPKIPKFQHGWMVGHPGYDSMH